MSVAKTYGSIIVLCVIACNLSKAWPNLLRGRQARSDSEIGSATLNDVSAKTKLLLGNFDTMLEEDRGDLARKRWGDVRDAYNISRKKAALMIGDVDKVVKTYRLAGILSFFQPYLQQQDIELHATSR
ncbi:uncharacterized protein LOC117124294 isoform X2 [Anneissia japonica]|uniref:uncharacterized protein LOC117124294 isoform X2 n=1 Tax=Anneissia japonica TaxID=1529436 RepID=UPI001425B9FC|nr:uncharacterized protein LOC117124294 isoform X2 [Anneissia japonica]